MKNRFAELLGVEYSIIQGGMLQLGFSKLAAAVSNAGGLRIITSLMRKPTPPAKPPRSAAESAANHGDRGPDGSNLWPSHHDQFASILAMK